MREMVASNVRKGEKKKEGGGAHTHKCSAIERQREGDRVCVSRKRQTKTDWKTG